MQDIFHRLTRFVTGAGLLLSALAAGVFTVLATTRPDEGGGPFAATFWAAALTWAVARRRIRA